MISCIGDRFVSTNLISTWIWLFIIKKRMDIKVIWKTNWKWIIAEEMRKMRGLTSSHDYKIIPKPFFYHMIFWLSNKQLVSLRAVTYTPTEKERPSAMEKGILLKALFLWSLERTLKKNKEKISFRWAIFLHNNISKPNDLSCKSDLQKRISFGGTLLTERDEVQKQLGGIHDNSGTSCL